MMQNIIRLKEFVAAAALTTGLVAVVPVWAGDAPTQGNTDNANPQLEKTKAITPEELDRKLGEQSERMKAIIDEALKSHTLSETEKQELDAIKNDIESMKNKTLGDYASELGNWASLIFSIVALIQSYHYYKEQNKDATRTEMLNAATLKATDEIRAATKELKEKNEIDNYQTRQEMKHHAAMI